MDAESLKIEYLDVDKFVPYEKNTKKHPQEQVDRIANSIKRFGFKQPLVVDADNVVVIGHGRLLAAKKLGMKKLPCIRADDLTPDQIRALRIADNKTNESEWDLDALAYELKNIDIDMSQFGLQKMFDAVAEKPKEKDKPQVEFTEVLGEEHNYIVLYFDTLVDWLQLQSLIDVSGKMNLSTNKDGEIRPGMERVSVGRVFKGKEVLESLRKYYESLR